MYSLGAGDPFEKKARKITLNDVNTKVDCIIESLDKKRKHEE